MFNNRNQRRSEFKTAYSKLSKKAKIVYSLARWGMILSSYSLVILIFCVYSLTDIEFYGNFALIVAIIAFVCLVIGLVLWIGAKIYTACHQDIKQETDSLKGYRSSNIFRRNNPYTPTTHEVETRSQQDLISSTQENIEKIADSSPNAVSQGILLPTICPRCHKSCPSGSSFCPHCGKQLKDDNKTEQ